MDELSQVEQEQETPIEREPVTGPLVPRWFKVGFYVFFVPLGVLAVWSIVQSLRTQHALSAAIHLLRGGLTSEVETLADPKAQQALAVMKRKPAYSFLYCNQEILQNEADDPRMARALSLRKALDWGSVSLQREVIGRIVAHMDDRGYLDGSFQITPEMLTVLQDMVRQRRNTPGMTYAEDRITAVLQWLAEGRPTPPLGREKVQLNALLWQLQKKLYVGRDAKTLELLRDEWQNADDPVARSAAAKFTTMLAGGRTELTAQEAQYVARQADRYEKMYRAGMARLSEASSLMLQEVLSRGIYLDHPHIFQFLTLLGSNFDRVRENVARGALDLRHNRYTVVYLSQFVRKATINPVMAVETERLTKEEHERLMTAQNVRRRRESVILLGQIGVDFMQHPDQYELGDADPHDFMQKHIIHTLQEVAEDADIADVVATTLEKLRAADAARPGGPRFFTAEGT